MNVELNTSEAQFLHKLIEEQNLRQYFDSRSLGIDETHFTETIVKSAWQYVVNHITSHNSIPRLRTVQEQIPEFTPGPVPERFEFYRDKIIRQFQKNKIATFALDLARMVQEDNSQIIEHIGSVYSELIKGSNIHDYGKFSEMLSRIQEYTVKAAAGEDPMGIPTGIPQLDEHFMGFRPGDYAVVSGRTGEGKTTLALFMAFSAFMAGYKVSYITLEMPREQLFEKLDALATGISINKIKRLKLTQAELETYQQRASEISEIGESQKDINIHDRTGECTSITAEAILNQDEPDILFIDSIYLMKPLHRAAQWQEITEISHALKQLAMKYRKPIVVLSQVNRAGEEAIRAGELPTLANLSFSDSVGFDADHVFVITSNSKTRYYKAKRLSSIKLRGASEKDMAVKWDPTTNFIEYLDEYRSLREPSADVKQIAELQEDFAPQSNSGPLQ